MRASLCKLAIECKKDSEVSMLPLAIKNLVYDKFKFLIGVFSVGISIALIFVLVSVYVGSIKQAEALPNNSGADYWVALEGTRDMFHTVSILPAGAQDALENLPSIDVASPVTIRPTGVTVNNQEITVGIIGFDTSRRLLEPWNIVEGTNDIGENEIVIDRVISRQRSLSVGDTINLAGTDFKIVGISTGTNAIVFQYVFVRNQDLGKIAEASADTVSFYLLKSDQSQNVIQEEVDTILPQTNVRPVADIAADNRQVMDDSFLGILLLLAIVGVAVGILVLTITVYNAINDKKRDYATLKAIGASNKELVKISLIQSAVISVAGYSVGVLLYLLIAAVAPYSIPAIELTIDPQWYYIIFIASIFMALIAAIIPVQSLKKIDPVTVFKS